MDAAAFEATATGEHKRELIERLFDELNLPLHERARHYAGVARILEERRPVSYISNISTATSDSASKRSTQASFASSRTSYASTASGDVLSNFPLPPVAEETTPQQALTVISSPARRESSVSLHRKLQKSAKFGRSSSVSDRSTPRPVEAVNATGTANGLTPRTRWCPWCQIYVSRPNDFKKHVLQYCCGLFTFVCRNPACRNLCGQERQARDHRRDSEDVHCRTGFFKVEMQCRREHFGCGYCSSYFDDLEKFIEHFGESCRPDRVQHRYQKSRQIRALLQQPPLLPLVEAMCLQYRGRVDSYRALWWTWKSRRMDCIIRKLEYGPKLRVDDRNPGIAYDRLEDFVKFLIQPSPGSVCAMDVVLEAVAEEKELPPLPMQDQMSYSDDTIMSSNNNPFDAQVSSQHTSTQDVRSSIAMSAQIASNPSFPDSSVNTWYPYNGQNMISHESTANFGHSWTSAVPGATKNDVMDGQWVSYPTMHLVSFQQSSVSAPQQIPQNVSQHEQQPSETDMEMQTTSWIDSEMYGVG